MSDPQAPLDPAEGNLVAAAIAGIVAWLVAGVVLLTQRDRLAESGASWWVATAGAGVLVGLVQLGIYLQRDRLRRARRARSTPTPTAGVGPRVDPPT
ncbi:MAG: DUF2530 domain-containing protein [Candidatus Nanopelagicales bacterium]